MYFSLDLQEST